MTRTCRYLHLDVNLRYRPSAEQRALLSAASWPPQGAGVAGSTGAAPPLFPGPTAGDGAPSTPGFPAGAGIGSAGGERDAGGAAGTPPYGAAALEEVSLGPNLGMRTSRRVSSGELQYFDHPYFGVLVLVTPYEPKPANGVQAGAAPLP